MTYESGMGKYNQKKKKKAIPGFTDERDERIKMLVSSYKRDLDRLEVG